MNVITAAHIYAAMDALVVTANTRMRADVRRALTLALDSERDAAARRRLLAILENARIAGRRNVALCQDTGMPVVFAELGARTRVAGVLPELIRRAVARSYKRHCFRASIQQDPLGRLQPNSYAPAIVHTDIVAGARLRLTLLPKGFGCENKSAVCMFNPTAAVEQIEDFIVDVVRRAGGSACPPFIVGVGIGGTQDLACLSAKTMLLRRVGSVAPEQTAKMEQRVLHRVNSLGVGPFGLGGDTTALAVHVGVAPTHIAGLPVAVNISCHALRSASAIIPTAGGQKHAR